MPTSKSIVHRGLIPGSPSATEYFLPRPTLPPGGAAALDPWLAEVAQADIDGIQALLEKRWASIRSEPLVSLKQQLLGYRPVSVLTREGTRGWLRLDNPKTDPKRIGTSTYLPPPVPEVGGHLAKLEKHGISRDSVFAEFLQHFGGLAEEFQGPGKFIHFEDNWITLSKDWENLITGYEQWQGSLMIYYARNGDRVLLRADGAVGWLVCDQQLIRRQSDDFGQFVGYYVNYRRTAWPLDSYGPD